MAIQMVEYLDCIFINRVIEMVNIRPLSNDIYETLTQHEIHHFMTFQRVELNCLFENDEIS